VKIALSTSVMQRGQSGVGQYVLSLARALQPAAGEHEFTLFVLEHDLPLFEFARKTMRLEALAERWRPAVKNIFWHQAMLPEFCAGRASTSCTSPVTAGCCGRGRVRWFPPSTIWRLFICPGNTTGADVLRAGRRPSSRPSTGRDHCRERADADHVREHFAVAPDRVTVVSNGLDHGRFHPGVWKSAREATCFRRGVTEPFFLYVARLEHPAKNHARLIAAFNRFKSATGSRWHWSSRAATGTAPPLFMR